MKANQAFKNDDQAVSPVIGVILMVAITVVLAAVVFVLVTRLSQTNSNATPKVNVSSENSNGPGGEVTVISIGNNPAGGMAWTSISFTGSAGCSAAAGTQQGATVGAGDTFGCSGNGSWNMVYTADSGNPGGAIIVAKGAFPA